MKWYSNLQIGRKLAWGFGLIIIMIIVLSAFSAITADEIDDDYSLLANSLMNRADSLSEQEKKDFAAMAEATRTKSNRSLIVLCLLAIITVVMSVFLAVFITNMIKNPIKKLLVLVEEVSNGNTDIQLDKNMITEDEIGDLTCNMYSLAEVIREMIMDLSQLTHEITINGNSGYRIDTKQYKGFYSEMIAGINHFTDDYMEVIKNIYLASDQVATGARKISENSISLAHGSNEQASSVEELTAVIHTINESTKQNADNAKEVEYLSISSRDSANKGDQNMNQMLIAMEEIKKASQSMLGVIKVIDDIASRTNILALNASIEAVRAGEHGKGFSVVADEVRNLASRSKFAVKETSELIAESIQRVNNGMEITEQTVTAIKSIIDDITKITDCISHISESCEEQALFSNQIASGIGQITDVAQYNSAASEEAAFISEELSNHADMLRNMVSKFKFSEINRSSSF